MQDRQNAERSINRRTSGFGNREHVHSPKRFRIICFEGVPIFQIDERLRAWIAALKFFDDCAVEFESVKNQPLLFQKEAIS